MKHELDWGVKITATSNGYVAEWDELSDDDDGVARTQRVVFEDSEIDGLAGTEKLLWFLIDFFGQAGGRHDKERLRVTREPGDKSKEPLPSQKEVKADEPGE